MVSTVGGIVIAVVVLLIAAAVGGVVFTQVRARRLGLPPPGIASYLPWKRVENPYGPPQPAPGGIVGWVNDQVRKVKNRSNRSAAGAYEQPLHGGAGGAAGRRGFGPLDPDEAWDARVGHEADGYGYLEEQELGRSGPTEYMGGGGYNMDLSATPGATQNDQERGRRDHMTNPFDDDATSSLRGVSPRPIDTSAAQKHVSKGDEPGSAGRARTPTNTQGTVTRENV